jgi:hypothetical protein
MLDRSPAGAIAPAAALCMASGGAHAFDDAKYPNWKGQWIWIGGVQWDSTKGAGRARLEVLQAIAGVTLAAPGHGGCVLRPVDRPRLEHW